jgi:hypothetical protein
LPRLDRSTAHVPGQLPGTVRRRAGCGVAPAPRWAASCDAVRFCTLTLQVKVTLLGLANILLLRDARIEAIQVPQEKAEIIGGHDMGRVTRSQRAQQATPVRTPPCEGAQQGAQQVTLFPRPPPTRLLFDERQRALLLAPQVTRHAMVALPVRIFTLLALALDMEHVRATQHVQSHTRSGGGRSSPHDLCAHTPGGRGRV